MTKKPFMREWERMRESGGLFLDEERRKIGGIIEDENAQKCQWTKPRERKRGRWKDKK